MGINLTYRTIITVFEVMRIPAVATDVTFPSEATLRERARIRLPATLLTARLAKS